MAILQKAFSKSVLIILAAFGLSGCAEYIIAEAAVNAVYHGSKALSEYSKSSTNSSATQSTMIACAFPDGKIYMQTNTQCRSNNGLIVDTDGKAKFGCRKSDGELFAATYNSCLARKGWIDNTITVECRMSAGLEQERSAFECLSLGDHVVGVPKQQTAQLDKPADPQGKCELAGSGYIVVSRDICSDLQGQWSL